MIKWSALQKVINASSIIFTFLISSNVLNMLSPKDNIKKASIKNWLRKISARTLYFENSDTPKAAIRK